MSDLEICDMFLTDLLLNKANKPHIIEKSPLYAILYYTFVSKNAPQTIKTKYYRMRLHPLPHAEKSLLVHFTLLAGYFPGWRSKIVWRLFQTICNLLKSNQSQSKQFKALLSLVFRCYFRRYKDLTALSATSTKKNKKRPGVSKILALTDENVDFSNNADKIDAFLGSLCSIKQLAGKTVSMDYDLYSFGDYKVYNQAGMNAFLLSFRKGVYKNETKQYLSPDIWENPKIRGVQNVVPINTSLNWNATVEFKFSTDLVISLQNCITSFMYKNNQTRQINTLREWFVCAMPKILADQDCIMECAEFNENNLTEETSDALEWVRNSRLSGTKGTPLQIAISKDEQFKNLLKQVRLFNLSTWEPDHVVFLYWLMPEHRPKLIHRLLASKFRDWLLEWHRMLKQMLKRPVFANCSILWVLQEILFCLTNAYKTNKPITNEVWKKPSTFRGTFSSSRKACKFEEPYVFEYDLEDLLRSVKSSSWLKDVDTYAELSYPLFKWTPVSYFVTHLEQMQKISRNPTHVGMRIAMQVIPKFVNRECLRIASLLEDSINRNDAQGFFDVGRHVGQSFGKIMLNIKGLNDDEPIIVTAKTNSVQHLQPLLMEKLAKELKNRKKMDPKEISKAVGNFGNIMQHYATNFIDPKGIRINPVGEQLYHLENLMHPLEHIPFPISFEDPNKFIESTQDSVRLRWVTGKSFSRFASVNDIHQLVKQKTSKDCSCNTPYVEIKKKSGNIPLLNSKRHRRNNIKIAQLNPLAEKICSKNYCYNIEEMTQNLKNSNVDNIFPSTLFETKDYNNVPDARDLLI